MASNYTFKCLWDDHRGAPAGWQVFGDAHHTGYTIDAADTQGGQDDINVVKEYDKESYLRSTHELDVMGRVHSAYRDRHKAQLEALIAVARRDFEGSASVIDLYEFAAGKL